LLSETRVKVIISGILQVALATQGGSSAVDKGDAAVIRNADFLALVGNVDVMGRVLVVRCRNCAVARNGGCNTCNGQDCDGKELHDVETVEDGKL
jgi:hypothetical protein